MKKLYSLLVIIVCPLLSLSQNVGIGTNTPGAKLEVKGDAASTSLMDVKDDTNNSRLFIEPGGNVGIGTASPGAKFQVEGNARFLNEIRFRNGGTMKGLVWGNTSWNDYFTRIDDYNGNPYIMTDDNLYFSDINTANGTPGAIRFHMDMDAGEMGIGTTSPAHALDVVGNVRASGDFIGNIAVEDTRSANSGPNIYDREVSFDFKQRSAVGVGGSGTFSGMMTIAPWSDNSGDASHQLNFNEGGLFWRQGQPDATTWGSWDQIMTAGNVNSFVNGDNLGNHSATTSLDMNANDVTDVRRVITQPSSDYDKLRLYSSSEYTIGMHDAMTAGFLNDWAMTFTFNNDADRGFIWRDNSDAQNDGAMSLTTDGRLWLKSTAHFNGNVGIGVASPLTALQLSRLGTGSGAYPSWITGSDGYGIFLRAGSDNAFFGFKNRNGGSEDNEWNTAIYYGDDADDDLEFLTEDRGQVARLSGGGDLYINNLGGSNNQLVYTDNSGRLYKGKEVKTNSEWVLSADLRHSNDDWCSGCYNTNGNVFGDGTDDGNALANLGFSVTIDGVSYSQVTLCTNGWIAFGSVSSTAFSNVCLPTSTISGGPVIYPYWDDLRDYGGGEFIRYGTVGSAPNRVWISDWQMRKLDSSVKLVNFQVMIHEGSGLIMVKYENEMHPEMNGQGGTIGFQVNSSKGYPITCNGKVLDDNEDSEMSWSIAPVR